MTYGRLAQIENMELNDSKTSHQRKGRAGGGTLGKDHVVVGI